MTDQAGRAIPPTKARLYDELDLATKNALAIPYDGTLRFPIQRHGAAYPPAERGAMIDLGPDTNWIIPPGGGKFRLSGVLKITPASRFGTSWPEWSGTL